MPWAGIVCPPHGVEPGRRNTIEHCLGKCERPCIAPPMLASLWANDHNNVHQTDYISASLLSGSDCARKVQKERFEPFWEIPGRRYWGFRGTLVHRMFEDAAGLIERYGWLLEMRMQVELQYDLPAPIFESREHTRTPDEIRELEQVEYFLARSKVRQAAKSLGFTPDEVEAFVERNRQPIDQHYTTSHFTGRYDHNERLVVRLRGTGDAYNPFTRKYADGKSMADKKAIMTIKGDKAGTFSKNLQDEHVWQFNIYRWMIARTRISDEVRAEFRALDLPALPGRNFPAPTELVMQGASMMEQPRSGAPYSLKDRGTTTLYDIDPVPVLPLHEIEDYVKPRALRWYRWLKLGEPTPVVSESKKWMCQGCFANGEVVPYGTCFPTAERKQESGDALA